MYLFLKYLIALIINIHRDYLIILCEYKAGLQLSNKLKHGNIKVLDIKQLSNQVNLYNMLAMLCIFFSVMVGLYGLYIASKTNQKELFAICFVTVFFGTITILSLMMLNCL